ncbi:MAG: HPr family phosphocarrier protein [Bacilli bacterium]|nr:HPr family phosphocarrier protein [Bacilli bacterium]
MKTFTYTIRDKEGVHARPAGIVVAEARKYASNITITSKGRTTDLKRIFGVMGLCIKFGEEITISVSGSDEELAAEMVQKAFAMNL